MRIIHLLVVGMLIFAAAYVYRIKMESTSRVERVQRVLGNVRLPPVGDEVLGVRVLLGGDHPRLEQGLGDVRADDVPAA